MKNAGIMKFVLPVVVLASMLNFILFYYDDKRKIRHKPSFKPEGFRTQQAKSSVITKHKCAICGRTEKDSEDLSFRFCSKCNGNYEYCQNHLFTHTHVE